jgi:hypothetical protein
MSTQPQPVAEALSEDVSLGDRSDWWGGSDDTDDSEVDHERVDPNDPAEIIAHSILRETATMICAATLKDEPGIEGGHIAKLFAFLDGETWNDDALHTENKAVELTDPSIRLGNHAPNSSLVGEFGCERHRKRYNPEVGYITGGETTGVLIQDRPIDELVDVVEQWARGVATRDKNGVSESDVDDAVAYARRLKENSHHNGFRDADIMAKVVERVQGGNRS